MSDAVSLLPRGDEPDAEIIARCRILLERAQSGELRALAYVTVTPGDVVGHGWDQAARGNFHNLLGGVAQLQFRLAREIVESHERG